MDILFEFMAASLATKGEVSIGGGDTMHGDGDSGSAATGSCYLEKNW